MQTLRLIDIPHSDLRLSAMCLGAGAIGTGLPLSTTDALYAAFREAGGNCFDTAHCYCFWLEGGAGSSERALGDCIRRHGDAGKVRVITKGGHPAVEPGYPRPDGYLSPEVLASDIRESLDHLGGEPIDLYFLHRDDPRLPVGEIIDALDGHVQAGRLRAIGVSNWSVARLAEAIAWSTKRWRARFVASQPQFSLAKPNAPVPTSDPATRYLTDDDVAWHARENLPAICYSPTAGGYFASNGERCQQAFDNPVSRARLESATRLAQRRGVSVNQIALAYLMHQSFAVIPILGTSSIEHLTDALRAASIELSEREMRSLRDAAQAGSE